MLPGLPTSSDRSADIAVVVEPVREVVEVRTDDERAVYVVEPVVTAAPGGGSGGGTVTFTQSTPVTVWGPIAHNLGYRPAAVSVFSLDFGTQYDEFTVQHLDVNTLRISMDVSATGVALIN